MEFLRIAPRGLGDVHKMLFDTGGACRAQCCLPRMSSLGCQCLGLRAGGWCQRFCLPAVAMCMQVGGRWNRPVVKDEHTGSLFVSLPLKVPPPLVPSPKQCLSWRAALRASSPPCTCSSSR